jgi:peptidoglycan/xylan/chitin deacetylase (PgdA/CDA1 family)
MSGVSEREGLPPEASALAQLKSRVVRRAVATALPSSLLIAQGNGKGSRPDGGHGRAKKRLSFTFDDGPDEMTTEYLDLLDRLGVRATFFLIGKNAEKYPQLVNEIVAAGHEVAGHGYSHRSFPTLNTQTLVDELIHTSDYLPPPVTPRALVRPPKGDINLMSMMRVAAAGYTSVLWSRDSDDCRTFDSRDVEARLQPEKLSAGEIVLLHEGQKWTLAALPAIVDRLHENDFELTTVSDLVGL